MTCKTFLVFILALVFAGRDMSASERQAPVIVAYVTSWSDVIPDPQYITHINYAFGHVTDTFDGVRVDNPDRLRRLADLKKDAPGLKVMLSVGGWGSGRFSEMAADSLKRAGFAADCRRTVDEFGLDGIDIDWEYPTSDAAGISSSPDDTANFTLLMRDLRKALGPESLLTLATVADGRYIDFKGILPYIDFVNTMTYDMGGGESHHGALYPSAITGWMTASQGIEAHLAKGVPPSKLVMGMPFYGRGRKPFAQYGAYGEISVPVGYTERWDSVACAPYVVEDATGAFVCGFENSRSIAAKCKYIESRGLRGAMYWDASLDNDARDLTRAVFNGINQKHKSTH